jgi:glycosyltransferase involved in cell wall biosynthesis
VDEKVKSRSVLLLTDNFGGGTGRHLEGMCAAWMRDGWEPSLYCAGPMAARPSGFPVWHAASSGRWNTFPLAQLRRLKQIARLVRERQPAVVHAYFFWPIIYARILKRVGLIRVLVENREDLGFGWGGFEYTVLRATAGLPDRVICVSEGVRSEVLAREATPPERLSVIRNGIDLPEGHTPRTAARSELGLSEDAFVVGMVANLNRAVKGVDRFLVAIPRIVEQAPRARFLVVGGGSHRGSLEAQARRLGIDDIVTFTGFRDDVHRCYGAMDLSVLTSLSEGLSITLLESMGHGLPVVVTAVGGNPEVVVDGETGYLVPPNDAATFGERVVQLAHDPRLRTRMGAAGRARVESKFRLDRVASTYLSLYEDIITDGSRSHHEFRPV